MPVSNDVLSLIGDGLEYRWNAAAQAGTPIVLTYSFGESLADYVPTNWPRHEDILDGVRGNIRSALEVWEAASGITFVEVPDAQVGEIRFALVDLTGLLNAVGEQSSGFGYYPFVNELSGGKTETVHRDIGGDIFLNANYYQDNPSDTAPGSWGYMVILHEIGHAIGFKHPFEGTPTIDPSRSNGDFTVMAYDVATDTVTLGSVDLEAVAYYYGTPETSLKASWNAVSEQLIQIGTAGADDLLGAHLDDKIRAGSGHDNIRTYAGDDVVKGGEGKDMIRLSDGDDWASGGQRSDVIYGGRGDDFLIGGRKADQLFGGAGEDTLMGGKGRDVLDGGGGADVFAFEQLSGKNRITDFRPGQDHIQLLGSFDSYEDIRFAQVGDDTFIRAGAVRIYVENRDLAVMMDEDNFLFG